MDPGINDNTDNMFLLFYYVHLIKNIQNNLIREKCQEVEFHADEEKKTAK